MSDIIDSMRGQRKSTKVSLTNDTSFGNAEKTLQKYLREQEKKFAKEDRKRKLQTAKLQAQELLKYEKAGIKITKAERLKILAEYNKKDQIQRLKDLAEYHKKSAQLQREYNKAILDVDSGATFKERVSAIADETKANIKQQLSLAGMMNSAKKLFDNLTQEFNSIMSEYAKYQIGINTRLQGTEKTFSGMSEMIKNNIGVTPYVKTQSMFENLNKLTELGIVYNLEQRAFLESIADNISTTFDATNSTLLRLVKLQQSDSTAARLGLETSVTQFLNRMYEDSSYLNNNFDTVAGALIEATSQMTNTATIQFEYIVQKWLGSLSSVGLSDSTVSSLAQAIGYLGSGNISGLESMGGMRNLLVMASSRSGNLNYADMLAQGLDSSQTNELLKSVVEYIQEIASTNNKVVQSQYASLFGITLSDMTAAKNLRTSLDDIANSTLNYAGAINELTSSMSSMGSRMSVATMMDNVWSNLQYGLATNIADNPMLFGLWKVTDMIQGLTGGINIPFITAMGTGVDVNTTVENIMKLGLVGVSTLGLMGDLISGIGNTFDPSKMLTKMQIGSEAGQTRRGSGLDFTRASRGVQRTVSASTYIGNTSGSDIQESTLAESDRKMKQKLDQAQEGVVDHTKRTADYLISNLDPKIDSMIVMIAKMASYSLSSGTGEQFDDSTLSKLMLGKNTGIVVSESNKLDERANAISSIDSNVSAIVQLLQNGISVSIDTPALNTPPLT
jgi:hypothetical protein